MSLNHMGYMNTQAGVCGFSSCLYAVYNNSPGGDYGTDGLDDFAMSQVSFGQMIADYLDEVRRCNRALANSIEDFTRAFPGFGAFSVDDYIATGGAREGNELSVAMPPSGVVDFLKRRCAFGNARVLPRYSFTPSECIIGIKFPGTKQPRRSKQNRHRGLEHWVYKKNQTIYSWGNQYPYRTMSKDLESKTVYRITLR